MTRNTLLASEPAHFIFTLVITTITAPLPTVRSPIEPHSLKPQENYPNSIRHTTSLIDWPCMDLSREGTRPLYDRYGKGYFPKLSSLQNEWMGKNRSVALVCDHFLNFWKGR